MTRFIQESLFVLGMLAGLGLAGGFALIPFRKSGLRFLVLAAPLSGLLLVVLGADTLYCVAHWRFAVCAAVAAAACIVATVTGLLWVGIGRPRWDWLWSAAAVLVLAPLVTSASDATTIRLGRPGLLYTDGTDHLGYAQLADWLIGRTVDTQPVWSPDVPYQAYPEVMYRGDPRFGSFFTLALIATVRRLSGAFSYDIGCAIVLAAGILGVTGAFARGRLSLLVLLAALLTCHWFDYGRCGYFAKLIAYPAALLIIGLFFALPTVPSLLAGCCLGALTVATAISHAGVATALFIAVAIAPYLVARWVFERSSERGRLLRGLGYQASLCAVLIGLAIVAIGTLARPVAKGPPDFGVGWDYVLPRSLDLDNQGSNLSGFDPRQMNIATAAAFVLWIVLIPLAAIRKDAAAVALLLGPLLLMAALVLVGSRPVVFQLIGYFYPMTACGATRLVEPSPRRADGSRAVSWLGVAAAIAAAAILISLRVSRTMGAIHRYAGADVPGLVQFSKRDVDRLARAIGSRPVQVDVTSPNHAIFLLVELVPRGVDLQWTPRSWKTIVSYTGWPPPQYPRPAALQIVILGDPQAAGARVIYRTGQYELLDRGDK